MARREFETPVQLISRRKFLRTVKDRIISCALLGGAAGAVYLVYLRNSPQDTSQFNSVVDKFHLSEWQKSKLLNIGAPAQAGAHMHEEMQGWLGPGPYEFLDYQYGAPFSTPFTTPYLETEEQLNNWYYLLTGSQRVDTKTGRPSPATAATAEIMAVADRYYGRRLR